MCSNTVLPCRLYLRHCILAARNLGQEVEDNFLDYTFLVRLLHQRHQLLLLLVLLRRLLLSISRVSTCLAVVLQGSAQDS